MGKVMKKYKNFKDFMYDNYYNEIWAALNPHIIRQKSSFYPIIKNLFLSEALPGAAKQRFI